MYGLLSTLTACNGFFVPQTSPPVTNGDYLYVANGANTYLAGFALSPTGGLSVLNNSPYNNGVAATSVAVAPGNGFLYAGTSNGIYLYAINGDGSLTVQNGGSPVAQDVIATALQVDATGNYLLAAGLGIAIGAQAIGIYQIGSGTGVLTPLGGSPLPLYTGPAGSTVTTPTSMLITPNNSLVYVALGSLGVQVLTLGSGGALSTGSGALVLPPLSTSVSPSDYGLASDAGTHFLFVSEINTGLRVFSVGINGTLTEISGSPYTAGTGPTGVTVNPAGPYVYVANKGSNNISAFSLNDTSGQLTAIAGSPFGSGGQLPLGIVTDMSNSYIAVINSGSNGSGGNSDLQIFSISTTTPGALTPGATASTGTDPANPQSIAATLPVA